MKRTVIWLDDWRDPQYHGPDWGDDANVVWIKSYEQLQEHINTNGLPDEMSFDYDLSNTDRNHDGLDCAKLVTREAMKIKAPFPKWHVHSEHPKAEDLKKAIKHYAEWNCVYD